LILLEGLLATDPYNPDLLVLAAQGYYGYGLFFVEDENHDRARTYYLNARDYGLRLLNLNKDFRLAPQKTNEDYENAMSFFDKSDVPALFWTAISWGAWIFMSLDNVQAVSELGKVVVLMQRALELDEKYYYGGPHLFYGVYYSAVSRMLGGDTEKALAHFNFAFEISQGKMLLQKVMFAQYYAYQIMDEELFKRTLTEVLDASDDLLPEARLLNIVAKKKALYLLNKTNELF
jgi:hypothetical protein